MRTFHQNIKTFDQSAAENLFSWATRNHEQISTSEEQETTKTFLTPELPSVEQQLWDNRAKLKEITAQYAICLIEPKLRNKFFAQIDWLLNSEHWDEDDRLADTEAFKTLVKFILNAKPINAPYLGLSDNGNILASWINNDNKISLECMPNNNVKWFISCVFSGKKERVGGEAPSLERLLAVIRPFQNAGWFKY